FQLTAVGSHPIGDSYGVKMSWTKGLLTSDHERGEVTASQYQATFHTDPTLTVGEHLGSLIITLCADDPSVCKSPLPGAPWVVPLQVIVKPSRDASKHVTVAMTPSTPAIVTYPGVVASIDLQGQFGGDTLGKRFQVGIVDPSGVLKVGVWSFDEKGFTGELTTAKDLVEGDYNGNVEVRLCYDDPYVCRLPAANSPLLVPWKIAVKAPLNLTVLTPVAGLGAWSTYQGNAAHTGFVPASFDVAKFTRRWSVPAPSRYGRDLNGAAIDNGTVFIVRYDAAGGTDLLAISEAAGMQLWRKSFGADVRVNSPAVGNGQVYVTTSGTADTFLWAFDQRTGALLSKTSLSTQLKTYAPPTVAGADLYTA
ncbi:MAG: PQQ-binding-like beta-propeller repeat protein, partial [Xanthomonadales bacterium]|nr:PQQ-binding-like beta-propeller repeat protein [Xanthomonadales bacterium]